MNVQRLRPPALLDRSPSGNLFKRTISQIPTRLGQLMYLASLRDPNTGVYRHHGFAAAFGQKQSAEVLSKSHRKLFREWLNLPLKERRQDLEEYLGSLDSNKEVVVGYWIESEGYLDCIPDKTGKAARTHFLQDMQQLLIGAKRAAAAAPDQSSSRRA